MLHEQARPIEPLIVVDFLNTLDVRSFGHHPRQPSDEIASTRALVHWASLRGLRLGRASEKDLARVTAAREALRGCLDGDCTAADRLADTVPLVAAFRDGAPALRPAAEGVDGLLGSILVAVILMQARGDWQRVKLCAAPDCRWAFYDTARNRLARWCSMAACGNRAKTRKYRSRHSRQTFERLGPGPDRRASAQTLGSRTLAG